MTAEPIRTRPPAVAGTFYPAEPDRLRDLVQASFADAVPAPVGAPPPKALVVPHAGLVYSGPIAASAYRRLQPHARQIRRIVLLGPSHRVAFRGIAASSATAFETPLGLVPIDTEAVAAAAGQPAVFVEDRAHAQEHSLEVQLPFLQTVVPDAALVPFVVGDATIADVSAYSYIAHAPEGNVALDDYANVRAWLARVEALPGFVGMPRTVAGLQKTA